MCCNDKENGEVYTHYIHMANIFTSLNIPIYRIFLLTGQVLFFATMQVFCSLGYYVPSESTNPKKTMRFLYPSVHRWHKVTGVLLTLDTIGRQNTFCFKNYINLVVFLIIILPPRLPFSDFFPF